MVKNAAPTIIDSGAAYIDSAYNYSKNSLNYEITFLEFGATGCIACRKMESVMEEVKKEYPDNVNVIILNILKPEYQMLMKYYGIAAIPTQVFLNKVERNFLDTRVLFKQMKSQKISGKVLAASRFTQWALIPCTIKSE